MSLPHLLDGTCQLGRGDIGGKAWAINHMRSLGLPVPPAFVLGTDVGQSTLATGALPAEAVDSLRSGIGHLEDELARQFGTGPRPLLVSVRSGAARSMPGMMDTLLNVGATAPSLEALAECAGVAFAEDLALRLAHQYANLLGSTPPQDPFEQLIVGTEAIFRSWNSERAKAYRKFHGVDERGGTAVTVQAMVFGNLDDRSGTGVLFTRNPLVGSPEPYGQWLPRAQGEDVVSGRADPLPLERLAAFMPDLHDTLLASAYQLEGAAGDVQDVEFTVESGRLWLLQTRDAKRSAEAAVRLAVFLAGTGVISEVTAASRIKVEGVEAILAKRISVRSSAAAVVLAQGEAASPGVASGVVVGSAAEAEERGEAGESVVLATATTDPDDVHGMLASSAVITEIGGATSHAAVVSREVGTPCVVGCGPGTVTSLIGREVTVDGHSGRIYAGRVESDGGTRAEDPDLMVVAGWFGLRDPAELLEVVRSRS